MTDTPITPEPDAALVERVERALDDWHRKNHTVWWGSARQAAHIAAALATLPDPRDAEIARLRADNERLIVAGELVIGRVLRDACELPDRTSPDDQPDMLMMTGDELDMLLRRHLGLEDARAALAPQDPDHDQR